MKYDATTGAVYDDSGAWRAWCAKQGNCNIYVLWALDTPCDGSVIVSEKEVSNRLDASKPIDATYIRFSVDNNARDRAEYIENWINRAMKK